MARLLIKTEGLPNRTLELRMGANRIGRIVEDNDFTIPHKSISPLHCEIDVTGKGIFLRDCKSARGTFVDGERLKKKIRLVPGHLVTLGEVELLVESTDVNIFIPEYDRATVVAEDIGTERPADQPLKIQRLPPLPAMEFRRSKRARKRGLFGALQETVKQKFSNSPDPSEK